MSRTLGKEAGMDVLSSMGCFRRLCVESHQIGVRRENTMGLQGYERYGTLPCAGLSFALGALRCEGTKITSAAS